MTKIETGSWRRIVRLFEQASDLPEEERDAFLSSCGEGDEIVAEARALLESDAAATDGFLAAPSPQVVASEALGGSGSVERLDRLGPYRLVKELGRGGMGTVYLGERDDGQFDDRVAVKLLHGIQTSEQRRRFLVERQILASLRHPHIAYLLDGGLGEGDRPYLVMELVDGLPIDRFCRERDSSVDERLRLFLQVAQAVEHAHRNLVVHRDLKPSNVMVVADEGLAGSADGSARSLPGTGTVKLLDFGIAKLLDDADPGLTRTGHRMMTPRYASPEQVRGDVVTTASDVYQLGVLLYELLTGRRPYRVNAGSPSYALAMAILESEPEIPSRAALRPTVRRPDGEVPDEVDSLEESATEFEPASDFLSLPSSRRAELDAILLTALSKDPGRRYGSVRAFADDLERFLDGRPVEARGDGTLYRLGKWIRRHKAATVAAVMSLLLVISVTVLGVVALVQARSLEAERNRAEDEARKAGLVADYLADIFAGADPETNDGHEPTARDLLELGASRIDELDAPEARLQLSGIMARAFSSLGDQDRARELAVERLRLARDAGDRADQAAALEELARIEQFAGRFEAALKYLEQAEPIRQVAASTDRLALANLLRHKGDVQRDHGGWQESEATLSSALDLYEEAGRFAGSDDAEVAARRGRARALTSLAGVMQFLQRLDEAETAQREALAIYEEVEAEGSLVRLDARHTLALLLYSRGQADEAVPMMEAVVEETRDIYGGDHSNLATALSNQGVVVFGAGRPDDAQEAFEEALAMRRRILPADHPDIANSLQSLGVMALRAGRLAESEAYLREALDLRRRAVGEEHPRVASTASSLADALDEQGRPAEALPLRRQALAIFETVLPPDSPKVVSAREAVETTLGRLGDE